MSRTSALSKFIEQQQALMEGLVKTFPDEEQLKTALAKSRKLSRLSPKSCLSVFAENVVPYRQWIERHDELVFENESLRNNPFFQMLNISSIWKGASVETRTNLILHLCSLLETYDAYVK